MIDPVVGYAHSFNYGDYVVPFQFGSSENINYGRLSIVDAKSHIGHRIKIKGFSRDNSGNVYYLASNSYYYEEDLMSSEEYKEQKHHKQGKLDLSNFDELL